MKKHLFLIILTLAVLSGSNVWAGTIDFLTNPNSYTLYTENASLSGSSIISGQNWCVYGWDLSGEDCSSWESFTVTYDNTVPGGGIKCLYEDSSQEWAEINRYGNNPTSATISFNRSKTISKVFVQVEVSGQTLTLNSAYITFEDPIDPCAMTTIQCETYNSSLFTSSRKTENSETNTWGNPDGEMIQNNSDGKEFFYYVELPEDANYTFKVHTSTQRSQNFKIYSLTGEGSDDVGYGGQTYYQKGSSTNVDASSESWNDYYAAPNAPTISLSKGNYVIGLSCNSYARFDKIVIVADDEVFCDPACTKHAVTLAAGANGYVSGGGDYCEGASVTVTATPNSGYRFVNWTQAGSQVSTNAEYTFTLLEDISLTANFEEDPCLASLTVQVEDAYLPNGAVSASKGYPTTMIFKEKQAEGSAYRTGCNGRGFMQVQNEGDGELFIPVNITTAGNYKVKARSGRDKDTYINIYAITGDGETITYNSTTYYKKTYKRINVGHDEDSFAYSDYTNVVSLPIGVCLIGLYSNYTYAAYDEITITCTDGTAFCPNTITMAKSGDDGATAPTAQVNSSNVTTAFEGAVVTVTAGEASANHYFSGWTVSPKNAVTFAGQTNAITTFVMPAEDVTITANYGEVVSSKFTYTTSGSGSITCATESGSNVVSGTAISMTAVPGDDYVFTGWTATAGTFSNDAALTTTFNMPAEAAEVTANFAQIDNVITVGSESGSSANNAGGEASITESNISDFDAFAHNVIKLAYSNMSGSSAYCGWNIGKSASYNSASSAGATGFGFYYKTESMTDAVALWFDPNTGNHEDQRGMQLPATENVWKYVYIEHAVANGWNHDNIIIYINGEQDSKSTAHASGAIYIADIAATSITSKPGIDSYTYTRNSIPAYGTLCLPMGGSVSGATLYSVAGKQVEGGKLYIVLEEQTDLVAGEPYIFEANGSTLTATMNGPQRAVSDDANGLVGTYTEITAPAYSESGDHNYVLAPGNDDNVVFKKVGSNVTVGAYRAYININDVSAFVPAPAMGRRYIRFGVEGQEQVVAIEMISDDASMHNSKVLQNGQLFIIRDGHIFNAQGTQIK